MPSTSNFDLTYNQQNVVAGGALSNPAATTGTSTGSGVTKILSGGSNVTLSPTSGVGDVTISVTSGGSGTVTEVKGQGSVNGITLTGDVTTSGYLTLGGTLGSIANTQLSNSTITIAGNSTALGGTVTQDQITGLSATTAGIVKHTTSANTLTLATAGTDYSAGTSSLVTGIVKSTTSTGALSIAAASDINSTLGTQSANAVYAGPSSGTTPANPAFRSLVNADLPTVAIAHGGTGVTTTPTNGQLLIGNTSTSGYNLATLTGAGTVSITNGPGTITITGSGGGGGGSVTQVNQGTGIALSPNPITTTGTVALGSAYAGNGIGTVNGIAKGNGTGTITAASAGTDYSAGTSALATGVLKSTTTTGALSIAGGSDLNSTFGSQTANTFYAAPNGSSGTPSFRAIVASDVPTLNQNTTGSAATLTTGRTIAITGDLGYTSPAFDGSGNVTATGTLATITTAAGPIGSSTVTPVITIDAKGRVTALSSATIANGGLPSGATTSQSLLQGASGAGWYTEHYNVKAFGAAGNGSADDTTPINNAISALNTAGKGMLFFPSGTYKITAALTTITVPAMVAGLGKDNTVISTTSTTANVFTFTGIYSVCVRDLSITQNSNANNSGYAISITGTSGLSNPPLDSPVVQNVNITYFGRGVNIYNTTNGTIMGCWIKSCVYGIYVDADIDQPAGGGHGDAGSGFVTNNILESCSGAGLYQTCNGGLTMTANQFHSNAYGYRYVAKDQQANSDIIFIGNWIDVWQTAAISFEGPATSGVLTNVVITGNSFAALNYNYNAGNVIVVSGTGSAFWFHQFVISGNAFQFSQTTSTTAIVLDNCWLGNITGNTFFAPDGTTFSAGLMVAGKQYTIYSTGTTAPYTDFTLYGSPNNSPGTTFTATGPATGNGIVTLANHVEYGISISNTCSFINYDSQLYYMGTGSSNPAVVDNQVYSPGSSTSAYIIASASSIRLAQVNDYVTITGTTTCNALLGGWQGRTISMYIQDGMTFTGGNIKNTYSASAGTLVIAVYDGTYWYLK